MVLASLVPDELADLLLLAYAADEAVSQAARDDESGMDVYAARKREALAAWRDVGETVANWLCSGTDAIVPIDEDRAARLAALPAIARAKNLELASALDVKVPHLRMVKK